MKLKFRKRQKKINKTMCFLVFTNDIKMLLYRISVCLYVSALGRLSLNPFKIFGSIMLTSIIYLCVLRV